jgi:uncharacterized membrane protein YgcG
VKKFVIFFILSFVFFLSLPTTVSAQEAINSFNVQMAAQKNGDLKVTEQIDYSFGSQYRHGIYRTIPLVSRVGDLYRVIDIKFSGVLRDGKKEKYSVDSTGEEVTVKIGDADRTITGPHLYEIDYIVKNGIGSNYADHDEIYWNVTGDQWEVPIATSSVLLTTDFATPAQKAICFTGVAGSTQSNCQVSLLDGKVKVTTKSYLSSSEGLTIVAGFPVGTFPKSTLQKSMPMDPDFKTFLILYGLLFLLLNFIVAPYLVYWYMKKRNKTRFGPPVVNFDLPKSQNGTRISPSEAGTIDNTLLDKEDIIATIFDLAIRKYIKIEGTIKKTTLGLREKQDFSLTRLKKTGELNIFETELLDALFKDKNTTTLKAAKLTYTTFSSLETKNFLMLIQRNFFIKNPKSQKALCRVFGLMTLFSGAFILGIVLLYLSGKLNGRTKEGDEMDWKLDGLKIFLKATKRYNVWQTKNFVFLEQMIPYAMALGVIEDYMKELKILKPNYSPSWYSGHGNFYMMYPLFASTATSNVTTTAPSSSSGFSGGSSGGGGGGGGGGSW